MASGGRQQWPHRPYLARDRNTQGQILKKGLKISENFLETTENYIVNKYRKDGFLNTKVTIETKKDTVGSNRQKILIFIDRGDRVKINTISFVGNDEFSDGTLRKQFKNTKRKF